MASKIRCDLCGEELEANIHSYSNHLVSKHKFEKSRTKSSFPSTLLERYLKGVEHFVLSAIAVLMVLMGFAVLVELYKNEMIVTPFDVPPDLTEATGRTIAEILTDNVNNEVILIIRGKPYLSLGWVERVNSNVPLQWIPLNLRPLPSFLNNLGSQDLTIKMEVGGISLDSFVSYFNRRIFKRGEIISGNVTKSGESIRIVARTNKRGPWVEEGKNLEIVIGKLAEKMAFDLLGSNHIEYINNIYRKTIEDNPDLLVELYSEWGWTLSRFKMKRKEVEHKYEQACKIAWNCGMLPFEKCQEKAKFEHKDPFVLVEWGAGLARMGEYGEARKKLDDAQEIDSNNPLIFAKRGYNEWEPIDFKIADQKFREYLGTGGEHDNAYYYYHWGYVLDRLGDVASDSLEKQRKYVEAIDRYQKAIEKDPKYYFAYFAWGLSLFKLAKDESDKTEAERRYHESMIRYQEVLGMNPKFVPAYNNLGVIYDILGSHEEAIKQFKKAIELDGEYYLAYYNLGYTFNQLGQYHEAIEKYKDAIARNPHFLEAYNGIGISLTNLGEYDEAERQFRKVVERNGKFYLAYYNWGFALLAQGNKKEAAEKFKTFLQISDGKSHDLENHVRKFLKM